MLSNHPFDKYEIWELHTCIKYLKDLYPVIEWHDIYFDQRIYMYNGSLTQHHWHLCDLQWKLTERIQISNNNNNHITYLFHFFYLRSCLAWLQHVWSNLSANIPVTDTFHWQIQRGGPGIRTPTFVRNFYQNLILRVEPLKKPSIVVGPPPPFETPHPWKISGFATDIGFA
jgi:hypothetical protein